MKEKMYFAGVDIGSTTSKCVLIDEEERIAAFSILDTKYDRNESGEQVLREALQAAGIKEEQIASLYSTGYGRDVFRRTQKSIPEIICHGRGTYALCPDARTVIDIGGQDSKIISLDEYGLVEQFEMNDKCAAGTGRFFEVLSHRLLNVPIDELGKLALAADDPCIISSTCTVFAESEIVSYLTQGASAENVAMGILDSIVRRIWAMGTQSRIPIKEKIVISGGIAHNQALKTAFEKKLQKEVFILDNPQLPAAMGAAILAKEEYSEIRKEK